MERIFGKMRVDEQLQRIVVFVGTEPNGKFMPHGTGFIAHIKKDDVNFPFLVTAHHVISNIRDDIFSVRMNRHAGSASTIRLDRKNAITHADVKNDIAIISIDLDLTVHNVWSYEISHQKLEHSADELNTGFGVVIPIELVLEILERNEVQEGMDDAIERVRKEKMKGVREA